jgi:hypothetical protein
MATIDCLGASRAFLSALQFLFVKELLRLGSKLSPPLRFHVMTDQPKFDLLSDLSAFRAAVLFPNDVSAFIHMELYAMNFPTFVPSHKLLVDWEVEYRVLEQRTIHSHHELRMMMSGTAGEQRTPAHVQNDTEPMPRDVAGRVPGAPAQPVASPFENTHSALAEWLGLSDLYTLHHFQQFDSLADLTAKLDSDELVFVSDRMRLHNRYRYAWTMQKWRSFINTNLFS